MCHPKRYTFLVYIFVIHFPYFSVALFTRHELWERRNYLGSGYCHTLKIFSAE